MIYPKSGKIGYSRSAKKHYDQIQETYNCKFNAQNIGPHLKYICRYGVTVETADTIMTQIVKDSQDGNPVEIAKALQKKVNSEIKRFNRSKQHIVSLDSISLAKNRTSAYSSGYKITKLFKGLSQIIIGAFGFSQMKQIQKTLNIKTKINGIIPYTVHETLRAAPTWTRYFLLWYAWAKGMEMMAGFRHALTHDSKANTRKMTLANMLGYYSGLVAKGLINLCYFMGAIELYNMISQSIIQLAKITQHIFNLSGNTEKKLKAALLSQTAKYFKPLAVMLKLFGITFIVATALSTLRALWKLCHSIYQYNTHQDHTPYFKKRIAKRSIKFLLKSATLLGIIMTLCFSLPVIGWGIFAVASTILGIWTLSKLWRKKLPTYQDIQEQVEVKPLENLNQLKPQLKNEFIQELKTALSQNEKYPARVAFEKLTTVIQSQLTTQRDEDGGKTFSEYDLRHVKAYLNRLYFNAQTVTANNSQETLDKATKVYQKQRMDEESKVQTGLQLLPTMRAIIQSKNIDTSKIQPKINPFIYEEAETLCAVSTAFLAVSVAPAIQDNSHDSEMSAPESKMD